MIRQEMIPGGGPPSIDFSGWTDSLIHQFREKGPVTPPPLARAADVFRRVAPRIPLVVGTLLGARIGAYIFLNPDSASAQSQTCVAEAPITIRGITSLLGTPVPLPPNSPATLHREPAGKVYVVYKGIGLPTNRVKPTSPSAYQDAIQNTYDRVEACEKNSQQSGGSDNKDGGTKNSSPPKSPGKTDNNSGLFIGGALIVAGLAGGGTGLALRRRKKHSSSESKGSPVNTKFASDETLRSLVLTLMRKARYALRPKANDSDYTALYGNRSAANDPYRDRHLPR